MQHKYYAPPVISERINDILQSHDVSDREVAEAVGMERKAICNYRNGVAAPSIKFVRWICSNYHIDANWLLDIKH